MKNHIAQGALFALASAISFTIMNLCAKLISHEVGVSQLIFIRFLLGLLIITPFVYYHPSFNPRIYHPIRYLVRVIAALLAVGLLFYIVQFMPLTDALLLNNTAPLFVPIIAWLMVRAKTTLTMWLGMILGFIGVIIILNPSKAIVDWVSLLGLASGFFAGLAIVQIRLLGKLYTTLHILFYYFLLSTLIMLPFVLIHWSMPHHLQTWGLLLGIGVFGLLYQLCSTTAYRIAPVRLMAPILYVNVVLAGLFDWLIWHVVPTQRTLYGGILITVGVIISLIGGQHTTNSTAGHSNEMKPS